MLRTPGVALLIVCMLGGSAGPAQAKRAKEFNCGRAAKRLATLERRSERRCDRAEGCSKRTRRRIGRLRTGIADACVRLNQVQVLGSHNSYHIQPIPPLFQALLDVAGLFRAWEYTHRPLDEQFEQLGVRQVELDVFADPLGGLFASREGLRAIGMDPASGLPELDQPGLKVLHVQDLDFGTTCLTFVACLQTIRAWSDANPGHLPLMVLVEAKDDLLPDFMDLHFAVPVPFGAAELDGIDAEIRSVFPPERLITPDDVRGDAATLEAAVLESGWPTLGSARGKVLFALDNGGAKREAYLAGHPLLEGRVLFTDSTPGEPTAAFVKANDPLDDPARIPALVGSGYIVRTRADADTAEARAGDTTARDAALASGAQFVSTDYEEPDPDFGTGYVVRIPDGAPARCNPVNAPAGCRAAALEALP